jgi:HAD superfamily hydrolase (TIGR01549 family)
MPLALFDLDDTLVDRGSAFHAWAEEFVVAHELDDAALSVLLDIDAHHFGPMDGFFASICERYNLAASRDKLWRQYRRRMPELASCRPADLAALWRLRAGGWQVGIVTNGMADNQLGKIRNTGLDGLVDGWCISDEVGVRKPNPEIFRLAAQRCGSSLGPDGWMTGDSLVLDVAGGHAAGLRTVWLQETPETAAWSLNGPAPDLTASSVAEAVERIMAAVSGR